MTIKQESKKGVYHVQYLDPEAVSRMCEAYQDAIEASRRSDPQASCISLNEIITD